MNEFKAVIQNGCGLHPPATGYARCARPSQAASCAYAPAPAGAGTTGPKGMPFAAVQAARVLLSFGGDVVVTSPPEVREDLLAVAASVTACYAPGAGG